MSCPSHAKSKTMHTWYALQCTLPPWSFEPELAELVDQLPRYGIDEVIVKVDTEDFPQGHPTLDWLGAYKANRHRLRDAVATLGIVYLLNPLGHAVSLRPQPRGFERLHRYYIVHPREQVRGNSAAWSLSRFEE